MPVLGVNILLGVPKFNILLRVPKFNMMVNDKMVERFYYNARGLNSLLLIFFRHFRVT